MNSNHFAGLVKRMFLSDLRLGEPTSVLNVTVGASLHSLARKRFPAATAFSPKETSRVTEGVKVFANKAECSKFAAESDARRAEGSS